MKTLITMLAMLWFIGWGYWFLYEQGHFISAEKYGQVNRAEIDSGALDTMMAGRKESTFSSSFLTHHPALDSVEIIVDSVMEDRKENESIQVISYYSDTEPNTSGEENLGIARSKKIIEESSKKYAARILQPVGLLIKNDGDTTGISSYFKIEKTDKRSPIRFYEDNRVLIFFPYASYNELASAKITRALDSLTNIWKTNEFRLVVSGHTDNDASETTNYNLGLDRAKSIQEKIVAAGFPVTKITTLSRGEKEPISINATNDGRYLNRRVEIFPHK